MSQRLKFKRLLCQTEMNHFSLSPPFKCACIFIYVRVYIFVRIYLIHVHTCMSRPEVGIQYLPGPISTWHIETGSLTWPQNSLISSSPWPGCFRNPISASRTQGLLVGYHAYPESIRVPRIQSSWVLYLVSHLPISKLLYLLEVNSVKMDKALCVVSPCIYGPWIKTFSEKRQP